MFVGPTKTGTTWLYEYARNHKQLSVSTKEKEIEFFNKFYDRGLDWYKDYFEAGPNTCDFSPTYFASDLAPLRLNNCFPHAKIIITLRNPTDRAISQYKHYFRYGIERKKYGRNVFGSNTMYTNNSFYSRHIKNWQNYFKEEQILFLPIELLHENEDLYLSKLCHFLKIEKLNFNDVSGKKINKSGFARNQFLGSLATSLRKKLRKTPFSPIVDFGKSLGLKRMLYSGGQDKLIITEEDINELNELFKTEIKYLGEIVKPDNIYSKYYLDKQG